MKSDKNKIVWDNYEEYTIEAKKEITNIIKNLDLKVIDCKEYENYTYSVAVRDTNTGLIFWLDYYYDEEDMIGDWNQFIFYSSDDNDMIRQAIQTSFYSATGDAVAFEEFDGVAYEYLEKYKKK